MPPTRREKAPVDPIDEFILSQSSNDFEYDLKLKLAQQYFAKLYKKVLKEERIIFQETTTNIAEELSNTMSELVEGLTVVEEAWNVTVSRYAALDDNIMQEIIALENHKVEMLNYAREIKKEAVFEDICEEQIQNLEEIRGAYGVAHQVWAKMAAAEGNETENLAGVA